MADFIEEAKERAHNFIELPHVRSHFRPYDPDPTYAVDRGNALDPLFEWSHKRTSDPPQSNGYPRKRTAACAVTWEADRAIALSHGSAATIRC
jgi:hypothetical protein